MTVRMIAMIGRREWMINISAAWTMEIIREISIMEKISKARG